MKAKRAIIFHSPLAENAPADELDVLHEAAFFSEGLQNLGYYVATLPFPYNLQDLGNIVDKQQPQLVVNLVETLFTSGKLVHVAPFLLEHFGLDYTGCDAHAIYLTSHKVLAKQHLKVCNINTPVAYTYSQLQNLKTQTFNNPFLVKSLWEHASFGMDENRQLLFTNLSELKNRFEQEQNPDNFFCEEYIHGREFNLSVIGGKNGPEVLPVAEIRFHYPPEKPRILGYKAKWEEESFEYKNTIRSFQLDESDIGLLEKLRSAAMQCWYAFNLRGYARVDFRVDMSGNIFVLEINANPCISPDSGFVAAAQQAGLTNTQIIARIIGLE